MNAIAEKERLEISSTLRGV
jgi:hypothetical protein